MFVIVIIIALLIAAFLLYAASKPDDFRVQRSATIKATAAQLYAHINDLGKWQAWSPWERLDPNVKRTFSGPASGVGAAYAWEGNSKVGMGSMQIIESVSPSKVVFKLDFFKPFEAHNIAEFTLQEKGDGTQVTWAMYGPQRYMMKVMGTLMDCDKMVGKQFEEGLANLKGLVEK